MKLPTIKLPKFGQGGKSRPGRSGPATCGLVIRDQELELLVLKGSRVASYVHLPIQGADVAALTQALRDAVKEAHLQSNRVAVAVPDRDVLIRFFSMPVLPKSEWESAIQFESRKYLPFKGEELSWDYHVLPGERGGTTGAAAGDEAPRMEVLFAAIRRDALQQIRDAIEAAGLQVARLESHSMSLARLAGQADSGPPGEHTCAMSVHGQTIQLAIVRDGLVFLARDLIMPPPVEPAPTGMEENQAGDPRAKRLLSELKVTAEYFEREHPTTNVNRVMLFSDDPGVTEWSAWLAQQFEGAVTVGQQVVDTTIEREGMRPSADAVGLALAGRSSKEISLDLLKRGKPQVAAVAQKPINLANLAAAFDLRQIVISLGVAGVVLGGFYGYCAQQETQERERLQQAIRSRPAVGWGLQQLEKKSLEPLRKDAQDQLTWLSQLASQRLLFAEKLEVLARTLPPEMWLESLQLTVTRDPRGWARPQLDIRGACFAGETEQAIPIIQEFEAHIKNDERFKAGFDKVQMGPIRKSGATSGSKYSYQTFQLQCSSKRL